MTVTIGTLLAAHAAGKPLTATIEETYDRIESHNDPALFIAIRPKVRGSGDRGARSGVRARGQASLWRSVCRQRQYRCRGFPHDGGLSGVRLQPREIGVRRREARRGGRDRHRQDESRSVCDRPGRRPLALWRSTQRVASGSHSWGVELRLGDGGRRRPRPVLAWHRHGGIRARAGGAQRNRGPEALARRSLRVRRRPCLPNARHGLDLRPRCRRRLRGLSGGVRVSTRADAYCRPFPPPALSAFPSGIRLGVPRADQRQFFDDANAAEAFSRDIELAESLAPELSSSTSSRSPRSPARSTKVRGSPSATPR